jgi:hypothetical protein
MKRSHIATITSIRIRPFFFFILINVCHRVQAVQWQASLSTDASRSIIHYNVFK